MNRIGGGRWHLTCAEPWRQAVLGPLFCLAAGCTVTLISRYDETSDRSATALQHQMDAFLTALEAAAPNSEEATYAHNQRFYAD